MFGSFLADEGVEMELDTEMNEVVKALDREVPNFTCAGYGFRLKVTRGVIGSEWRFLVNTVNGETGEALDAPLAFVIVTRREDGATIFRIPPRSEWDDPETRSFDADGRLFTGFILQILETFQRQGWTELPGPLPER